MIYERAYGTVESSFFFFCLAMVSRCQWSLSDAMPSCGDGMLVIMVTVPFENPFLNFILSLVPCLDSFFAERGIMDAHHGVCLCQLSSVSVKRYRRCLPLARLNAERGRRPITNGEWTRPRSRMTRKAPPARGHMITGPIEKTTLRHRHEPGDTVKPWTVWREDEKKKLFFS